MKDAFGVERGEIVKFLTIGDDKRVRRAHLKERQSGLNTDLAGAATIAGASHAGVGTYNRLIEDKGWHNLKQLKAPGQSALTNTRLLKPVQAAQNAGGMFLPGKAGRIVSHPALLGGAVVGVGVPLTIANHRQHNRDEKRVQRLEVRYPKRKKEKS